tara:strand:- start:22273 stop:22539 length:267 start_codon:yes stop_codon:yes gene_type:complete
VGSRDRVFFFFLGVWGVVVGVTLCSDSPFFLVKGGVPGFEELVVGFLYRPGWRGGIVLWTFSVNLGFVFFGWLAFFFLSEWLRVVEGG